MTIPFMIWTLLCGSAQLGITAFQYEWRKIVRLQLRLDQRVGETALELRDLMNQIEKLNQTITQIRTTLATHSVLGLPLQPALLISLQTQVKLQDLLLLKWKAKQIQFPGILPKLLWIRPPPDILGPQSLKWKGGEQPLVIQLNHSPRKAAATVSRKDLYAWQARWTIPH